MCMLWVSHPVLQNGGGHHFLFRIFAWGCHPSFVPLSAYIMCIYIYMLLVSHPLKVGILTFFKLEVAIPVSLRYVGGCHPPLEVGIPMSFKVEVAIPFSSGLAVGAILYMSPSMCIYTYMYSYVSLSICICYSHVIGKGAGHPHVLFDDCLMLAPPSF